MSSSVIGYRLYGSGNRKVVVLHNWFGDSRTFDPMLPYLDSFGCTYLFIDLRGYGKSKDIQGRYSVEEAASDTIKVIDHLGWNEVDLIGHSMSGMIVQKLAVIIPKRVKSIVAIAPTPASGSKAPPEVIAFLEDACRGNDGFALQAVHSMTQNRYTDTYAKKVVAYWRECSTQEARIGYLHMYTSTDFSKEVEGLCLPILVISPEYDFPGYEQRLKETFLKWYPRASIVHCENSGHFPIEETPVWLASEIERFYNLFS